MVAGTRWRAARGRAGSVRPAPMAHALVCVSPRWPDTACRARAIGSAGERLVHTEEVTGSIPVSPTHLTSAYAHRSPPRASHVPDPWIYGTHVAASNDSRVICCLHGASRSRGTVPEW